MGVVAGRPPEWNAHGERRVTRWAGDDSQRKEHLSYLRSWVAEVRE